MKKISFRVRSFDKEQFLTFDIDNEAELDEELLDFLEDEEPEGIVPVIFEEQEEFDTFSYDITDKIHLCELSGQEINAEMVLMVLRGLVLSLMNMSEYRIPLSYLVLNRQYIYIDSDYKVEFVCIPLEDMKEEADLTNFFRNFIASLRFDSSENGDYVAKLLTYVNNRELFNLRNLLELVEEQMERFGIDIPEDGSNEIYGEYTEVEESTEEPSYDNREETDKDILNSIINEDNSDDTEELESDNDIDTDNNIYTDDESTLEEPESVYEEPVEPEPEAESVREEPAEAEPEAEPVREAPVEAEPEAEPVREELAEAEPEPESVSEEPVEAEPEPALEEPIDVEPEKLQEEVAEDTVKEASPKASEDVEVQSGDNELTNDEQSSSLRSFFKTKDNVGAIGVVIEDDFDAFLAEKEKEDQDMMNDESGLKIRKDIKINRASLVKNTQEEASEESEKQEEDIQESKDTEKEPSKKKGRTKKEKAEKNDKSDDTKKKGNDDNADESENQDESKDAGGSIISQTIGNAANNLMGGVPKVNPYLIRVNTDERIMIKKQTFKIGKAGMGVDYTIDGNGAISRVHAIITCKDGEYFIKDNKSTNHTFVDGKNVEDGENVPLTDGCKIVLGDEEFIFKL